MKWIGAGIILTVCAFFGWSCASSYRQEEHCLRNLIGIINYMACELQYRLTPLPELCQQAAKEGVGVVYTVFYSLAEEMHMQISPDVSTCMRAALSKTSNIPLKTYTALETMGQTLGRFDVAGQMEGLEAVRQSCKLELDKLMESKDVRLRNYQTLGLCAGASLIILFI